VINLGKKKKQIMAWKSFVHGSGRTVRKVPKHVQKFISDKIENLYHRGYPQEQSIAIAYSEARKKFPRVKGLKKFMIRAEATHQFKAHEDEEAYGY
jgi:hypothetical protein